SPGERSTRVLSQEEGTSMAGGPRGAAPRWSRRRLLAASAAWGMAASLAACQPRESSAPATPERAAAKPDGWDALVTAARGEGTAVIYGAATTEALQVFAEDFARAYPDIKVEFTFAIGSDLVSRIVAERQAGRYIPDLLISGSTYLGTLKPMGALAPLRPTFVLAEVADPSGWLQGKLWWADEAEPYTTLHFQGLQAAAVFVPPTLV